MRKAAQQPYSANVYVARMFTDSRCSGREILTVPLLMLEIYLKLLNYSYPPRLRYKRYFYINTALSTT